MVDEKRKKYVKAIFDSSESIYKLLDNLLEWSRAQTKNIRFSPTHFIFDDVIKDNLLVLQETINNKRIEFLFVNKEEIEVFTDRKMISTVFRNILSNAIKFTGIGGEISVFFCSKNSQAFVVCVKDTGVGMEQNDADKLFKIDQNFVREGTSGEKGTGLGLLICKEFIENHSGKIWVESAVGKGSAFYFTIPNSK